MSELSRKRARLAKKFRDSLNEHYWQREFNESLDELEELRAKSQLIRAAMLALPAGHQDIKKLKGKLIALNGPGEEAMTRYKRATSYEAVMELKDWSFIIS